MDSQKAPHIPVLCQEVIALLAPKDGGHYLDGTLGFGGHTKALLLANESLSVLGLDRDREALGLAKEALASFGDRIHFAHGHYGQFPLHLHNIGWEKVDGALIDIGVSSMQLDQEERGFSFLSNGRLDMRMNQDEATITAWDLVNHASAEELRDIIARFGEEPKADAIVRTLLSARKNGPITTTQELASLVEKSYPKSWLKTARHHPATRTFQALRMAVNNELGELEDFLRQILNYMPSGGRLCVLTFHSLEDRIVKQTMARWAKGCLCPAYSMACTCGHVPEVRILTKKPLRAQAGELAVNPRASSAKLRAVEKL